MSETPEDKAIKGRPVIPAAKPAVAEPVVLGRATSDDLDAAYAEIRRAPYCFTWSGREWQLPSMSDLDFRMLMRIEQYESMGVDELAALFGDLFSADQRDAWAETPVPIGVLQMLFDRWTAHSGAQPGEAPASSSSSGSTGKSSRRTSGGSTGSASRSSSTAKKATRRAPRKAASPPANSSS